MSHYEIAILGDASPEERTQLETTLTAMLAAYDLKVGADVLLLDGGNVSTRNRHVAFAAACFRGKGHADEQVVADLVGSSAAVIPVISNTGSFETDVPDCLQATNGYKLDLAADPEMSRLASALLECMGLLQRQRRVFVSYRRTEARAAAVQLHDELSANGFDVFLDTHDISPGEQFQEALWHRLCDSDVMIMLDTETYFERKWTRQELGRARATGIHILQVVWPNHRRNAQTDLAETIYLEASELTAADGPIVEPTVKQIIAATENLRSRSVAARMMSIVGKLRVEAQAIRAQVGGIGAHRAVSIVLPHGRRVFAYPVVGVPTADMLNDVANKAQGSGQGSDALLVYDHLGIRPAWLEHLRWLDDNIHVVRAIRAREAAWALMEF
ncbi:toll/interleukin-1 receptor domain-containing protein [Xanthomonas sp. LF06-19]|uniref:toll/interleukin-1 receptor domain-containing protein n=1 Tax=Xanthomonas sp. LF06-19 TaxID=3097551 RepID=UPI002A83B66C|nr:toll/interleukin-1 receptor domain-containing protein [Xanthomonas sp. LF06-19]MDY4283708.1 toll/interleukin-1 receptor domain-containing protein [Xanthomonas sp. LF06-19]